MTTQIPKVHISKIDAAKRQLETAITLYFQYGDPVSTHTLAAAAYDVLHALCKVRGIKYFIKDTSMIRKGKEKEYLDMLNAAQNFFKHGSRDLNGLYEFRPLATEFFIWDACQMYKQITTEEPKAFVIFNMWFYINHADIVADEGLKQALSKVGKAFTPGSRTAFYQEASLAYDQTHVNK